MPKRRSGRRKVLAGLCWFLLPTALVSCNSLLDNHQFHLASEASSGQSGLSDAGSGMPSTAGSNAQHTGGASSNTQNTGGESSGAQNSGGGYESGGNTNAGEAGGLRNAGIGGVTPAGGSANMAGASPTPACSAGQTNPIPCGSCGINTQTCSPQGAWRDAACKGEGCEADTTRTCNTYGMQTCGDACTWGTCSCAAASVCTPEAVRCSGNGVQTCNSCGQWGTAVACGSDQSCLSGVCSNMFASCAIAGAGKTACTASISANCCSSKEVTPNGSFFRTYGNSGSGATGLADSATVTGFRLDTYLVTVGRFRAFVAAWNNGTGWLPPAGSGKHAHLNNGQGLANSGQAGSYEPGWNPNDNSTIAPTSANLNCSSSLSTGVTPAPANPNVANFDALPINCVNWYESYAFCIWDGGFLPSETEWEYAAAGGSLQLQYPWGSSAPGMGNQYAIYGCYYQSIGQCESAQNIAPPGTAYVPGHWGQVDLAGDLAEWTLDASGPYVSPCTDCAQLTGVFNRTQRGGDFMSADSGIVPWVRLADVPAQRSAGVGFRCARTP